MEEKLHSGTKYSGYLLEKFESPLLLRPDKFSIPISAKLDIKYLNHGDIPTTTKSEIRITSLLGKRFINKQHYGLDFGIQKGAVVVPMKSGVVSFHGHNDHEWGYYALIKHADGSESIYCHLLSHDFIYRSLEGNRVTREAPIGKVGNTGLSKGGSRYPVHLHVGIRVIFEADRPQLFKATAMRRENPDVRGQEHYYYDVYEIWRNNE